MHASDGLTSRSVFAFPTETEIYLLPDGRVVFADLPAELAELAAQLGAVEPCALVGDIEAASPAAPTPPAQQHEPAAPAWRSLP